MWVLYAGWREREWNGGDKSLNLAHKFNCPPINHSVASYSKGAVQLCHRRRRGEEKRDARHDVAVSDATGPACLPACLLSADNKDDRTK